MLLCGSSLGVCAVPQLGLASPTEIAWRAPAECPQANAVEEGVERLIGADREIASSDTPRFSGIMAKLGEGVWKLELSMTSAEGTRTRELSSDSCHELTEAGIAVIALALSDTTAKPVAPPPSKPPASSLEPTASRAVVSQRESNGSENPLRDAGPPPNERTVHASWGAQAAMVVDFQMLPSTTAGAALGVGYSTGSWELSARALYLPPQTATLAEQRGAEISLISGSLGARYWWLDGTLALGSSLQVEAGTLPAQGVSEQGTSGNGRWAAAVPGMAARWQLDAAWALHFGADLVIPLVRDEFMLGADQVYQVPALGGRLVLGPEVRFR